MNVPLTPIRFLRYAGEQFAGDVAIVCGDQRFTYAQFADRAARLAGALRAEGAGPATAWRSSAPTAIACSRRRLRCARSGLRAAAPQCPARAARTVLRPQRLRRQVSVRGAGVAAAGGGVPPRGPGHRTGNLLDGEPGADRLSPHTYEQLIATAAPWHRDLMAVDENALADSSRSTPRTRMSPRRHADAPEHLPACVVGDRVGLHLPRARREHLLRQRRPAHHLAVSRQRLGIGAHRDRGRRHACHGPSVHPRRRPSPDRAREGHDLFAGADDGQCTRELSRSRSARPQQPALGHDRRGGHRRRRWCARSSSRSSGARVFPDTG